ncbi:hypothetical protein [Larkinella terrae]|uniref:Uncharacterized protein n=2 Tax=Larkinella terrae TaxID=2025311 RepID=A0A7K0EE53_9BACT|nr:hypothetical protein [Larkinella terrae]
MIKYTLVLAALACVMALVFILTSDTLRILSGVITVGLVICAGFVHSAVLVDEDYNPIPDELAARQITFSRLNSTASVSEY